MKEYTEDEKPTVEVRAYQNNGDNRLIIEIKDNGCGMTESVKANIFTPFFSKKNNKGTGLGLAIASRMVNAHHGRIDVVSEPEKGTLFQIVLPIDTIHTSIGNKNGKKSSSS
jgi:two-component system sensor histidine kinase AtoS